jgi:hypothetical protein
VISEAIVILAGDYGSSGKAEVGVRWLLRKAKKDHIMKILIAAAIVSFALVAPTLAMPIASPAPAAHSGQAVVQVQYNHYRGGGHGHHYGRGHGHHYGWGNSYHHHRHY